MRRWAMAIVSRGFTGRPRSERADLPPGQYLTKDFPVLSAGPTPRTPLDRFLLAALEEKGLRPAPAADRRTLIRRATFDLTGLPPAPEEVAAFLADDSRDAFARVVDRLLASPAYGERWGRHWLDVERYADIDERMYAQPGIHLWRDWVIRALNNNMPFDEFVRTQLTGYRNERTQMSGIGVRSRMEARLEAPEVVRLQFVERAHRAGEEAAPERAVGDDPDPVLAGDPEHLGLEVARPQ